MRMPTMPGRLRYFFIGIVVLLAGCPMPVVKEFEPPPAAKHFEIITARGNDSLATFSRRYDVPAWQIDQINAKRKIFPKQTVVIPRSKEALFFQYNGLTAKGYQVVPTLTYHHFSKRRSETLYIREADFEAQMAYLQKNGYAVISITDFQKFLEKGQPIPQKSVLITIDDGWSDAYDVGFPVLKRFKYPFTFFIQTNLIDNVGGKTLTWNQVKEMTQANMEVECHTKTHAYMTKRKRGESWGRFISRLESDLSDSARRIKQATGKQVRHLAYPYGDTNQLAIDITAMNGYATAFTVNRDSNSAFENNYRLNRAMIFGNKGLRHLENNLETFVEAEIAEPEPIDSMTSVSLPPPGNPGMYEKRGQWRTALFYWRLKRDYLVYEAKNLYQNTSPEARIYEVVKNAANDSAGEEAWILARSPRSYPDYLVHIDNADRKIKEMEKEVQDIARQAYQKGVTAFDNGRKEAARLAFMKALLYDPWHAEAREYLKEKFHDEHKYHRAQSGESLRDVARKVYRKSDMAPILAKLNGLSETATLRAGDKIKWVPLASEPTCKCKIKLTQSAAALASKYYSDAKDYSADSKLCHAIDALKLSVCLNKTSRAADLLNQLEAVRKTLDQDCGKTRLRRTCR